MTLSLEAAFAFVNNREQELLMSGWSMTPAEKEGHRVVAQYAWLGRTLELFDPELAKQLNTMQDVTTELRGKE